ncbi:MAG: enoyl-CoA hydratase/isomerase family protein [Desulfohalobiaceae bacterium]|nr:enoyl-CoA hydratase/isomerase family protein [Desulfohalobiaceae bacterium]
MEYKTIAFKRFEDGYACLRLNRPDFFNAINQDLVAEVQDVLQDVQNNERIRVLVLTGTGKAFCAGGDLSWLMEARDHAAKRDIVEQAGRFIRLLHELPTPVIAAVNGVAAGAGTGVALACDILIAADTARFAPNFVNIGAVPDSGTSWFLPRTVGYHQAAKLMLTGELLSAAEALDLGIFQEVVPAADLESRVFGLAKTLAEGPQQALSMIKRMLKMSGDATLQAQLEIETSMQVAAWSDPDFQEGVAAFLERRKPAFK